MTDGLPCRVSDSGHPGGRRPVFLNGPSLSRLEPVPHPSAVRTQGPIGGSGCLSYIIPLGLGRSSEKWRVGTLGEGDSNRGSEGGVLGETRKSRDLGRGQGEVGCVNADGREKDVRS